jgi:hypothetical protein
LGVIMMRLYADGENSTYLSVAQRLLSFLQHVQQLNAVGRNRAGAIAGSYPIWGPYAPLRFPCWATKYYLDLALMLSEQTTEARSSPIPSPAVAR